MEAGAEACPGCGAPVAFRAEETLSGATADSPRPRAPIVGQTSRTATPVDQGGTTEPTASVASGTRWGTGTRQERFSAGQVVAGRYRITSLQGRGGMGEVYRADDMTLGQTVALKFLPPALAADSARVQRLFDEVRITRQISHPNVCRVYDVHTIPAPPGSAPDEPATVFLAMEFIDGEELGSLLRRIGRLPGDKALEVARQLCAGLAAAHEQGVVHRDLKPSNIMIDGRGRARLTDFGIAGALSDIVASGDFRAGTPTYMSPEQLNGSDLSLRSDIYALGLVLYELFTGKPVFRAKSLAELKGLHATTDPAPPSTLTHDIDPLAERVIMRCLEKDPAFRPASALAVSMALPGGDPLAAALAAGETPSPEMVAASGGSGAVSMRFAVTCMAFVAIALAALVFIKNRNGVVARVPFELSTEVLSAKAREMLDTLAPAEKVPHSARGFFINSQVIGDIDKRLSSPDRWESLKTGRPTGIVFWYRRSGSALNPVYGQSRVLPYDPPLKSRSDARVMLDTKGRLIQFDQIPRPGARPVDPVASRDGPPPKEPDWSAFFSAGGLDSSKFRETPPIYGAEFATDTRRAWTGEWPMEGAFSPIPIRVEAASFDGQPVSFDIIASWHTAPRETGGGGVVEAGSLLDAGVFLFTIIAGPFLAWRHVRTGRGDRRGAFRLALFVFVTTWLYLALPSLSLGQILSTDRLQTNLARAAWSGLFGWVLYMALEPYIRRIAPWAVIGWTRLISGRVVDPLVGRDVLIGVLVACGTVVVSQTATLVPGLIGAAPTQPLGCNWGWFGGPMEAASTMLMGLSNAVFIPMYLTIVTVGLRWLLRSDLWAIMVVVIMATLLVAAEANFGLTGLVVGFLVATGYAIALVRFGLLAVSATSITTFLISTPPVIADPRAWFAPNWMFPYGAVVVIVLVAAYAAVGGRAGLAAWRMSRP